jgi:S1-C subfamily serine protease
LTLYKQEQWLRYTGQRYCAWFRLEPKVGAVVEGSGNRLPPLAWLMSFIVVGVLAGAASGAATFYLLDSDSSSGSVSRAGVAIEDAVVKVGEFAMPSVVTIINELPPRTNEQGLIVDATAVGTGIIVDERGFIVTNEHVIHDPGTLRVVLDNGEERPAERVSHDAPFTDLAVIRIPSGGLKALRIADSDDLVLGQTVVAIGSALYVYPPSLSVGVVSGLHRRWLRNDVYMEDLIQTDTAINRGNSGGPLLNLDGDVVGVASTIVRQVEPTSTVWGVSFAISSRTFQPIIQSIIRSGSFPRPYFGIDHQDIDVEYATEANLDSDYGALVLRVFPAGPADKAGFRSGDIILQIGEHDVTPEMPFINALARARINARTTCFVLRDGQVYEVPVDVVAR